VLPQSQSVDDWTEIGVDKTRKRVCDYCPIHACVYSTSVRVFSAAASADGIRDGSGRIRGKNQEQREHNNLTIKWQRLTIGRFW
jgi:hypothetical protein